MALRRTIGWVGVVSPVLMVAVISGCKTNANSAAWEDALDASLEDETKTSRNQDAGDDKTSTSTGKTQTPSSTSLQESSTAAGSSAGTSAVSVSSGAPSSSVDEGSTSDTRTPSEESSTSPPDNGDAGGDTLEAGVPAETSDCGDYIFCETFEDVALGEIPDGWERRGEPVGVSSEHAFRGGHSLKLGAVDDGQRRIVRNASVLGSAHWGRIYYRVDVPVPDPLAHSTMVALSGDGPESGPSEYRVIDTVKISTDTADVGGKHNWMYNVQPNGGAEFSCGNFFDWEFDGEWHCVEYYVDASTQSYRFFYEGEEQVIDQGEGCGALDLPDVFEELRVGWNNYQEAPPGYTAYIDDIAFDDDQIGCD